MSGEIMKNFPACFGHWTLQRLISNDLSEWSGITAISNNCCTIWESNVSSHNESFHYINNWFSPHPIAEISFPDACNQYLLVNKLIFRKRCKCIFFFYLSSIRNQAQFIISVSLSNWKRKSFSFVLSQYLPMKKFISKTREIHSLFILIPKCSKSSFRNFTQPIFLRML